MYYLTPEFKTEIKAYILDNICLDNYAVFENVTSLDNKIKALYFIYGIESHQNNRSIEDWLGGLPSCLTIPYTNYDIQKILDVWYSKFYKTEYDVSQDFYDQFTVRLFHEFIAKVIKENAFNS
jgi:hypothetical protein